MENNESTSKTPKQIWIDLIKDLIGFEKGYYFTLKAIYLNPQDVFESYFNNRARYLSPFTLIGISFSIYYLISGFLVDWGFVSDSIENLYKSLIEFQIRLMSNKSAEVNAQIVNRAYSEVIVPMVDLIITGISRYAIVIVFPIELAVLYATSLFTRKIGFGFYHHFVSFNYFFSFSLLFLNLTIILSMLSVWLIIPCVLVFNYFFYGLWFKSYGEKKGLVKKAFIKGAVVSIGILFLLSGLTGFIIGAIRDMGGK